MTIHAEEEMYNDGLTIYDVESVILTGIIVERQSDTATGEWKYCVQGTTVLGGNAEVVAKISSTEALVFITVYII
jgi:hypothetical protein